MRVIVAPMPTVIKNGKLEIRKVIFNSVFRYNFYYIFVIYENTIA